MVANNYISQSVYIPPNTMQQLSQPNYVDTRTAFSQNNNVFQSQYIGTNNVSEQRTPVNGHMSRSVYQVSNGKPNDYHMMYKDVFGDRRHDGGVKTQLFLDDFNKRLNGIINSNPN